MPELVLRPSRAKTILLLLVALVFVAIGVFALADREWGVGLSCTIFFGLGAVIAAIQLRPGAAYLRLTEEGFVVCSMFRAGALVPWNRVSNFRVGSLPLAGKKMVVYDSSSPTKRGLRQINRELIGASDGLPDNYGMKYDALAALMNDWRARATGEVESS